jgi:hypothetical protein
MQCSTRRMYNKTIQISLVSDELMQ